MLSLLLTAENKPSGQSAKKIAGFLNDISKTRHIYDDLIMQ
jgi:hypothetical protein